MLALREREREKGGLPVFGVARAIRTPTTVPRLLEAEK